MDKSLDEIINSERKTRHPRRAAVSKAKASTPKRKPAKKAAETKPPKQPKAAAAPSAGNAKRALVSGLPADITEKSVKEFFHSRVGPVASCMGSYNRLGKPTGSFTVSFRQAGDALKAHQQFSGTPVDNGKTKMKIEVLLDVSAAPERSLADRLKIPDIATPKKDSKSKAKAKDSRKNATPKAAAGASKRSKGRKPPRKTKEDLDAEMDSYFAAGASSSAATGDLEIIA